MCSARLQVTASSRRTGGAREQERAAALWRRAAPALAKTRLSTQQVRLSHLSGPISLYTRNSAAPKGSRRQHRVGSRPLLHRDQPQHPDLSGTLYHAGQNTLILRHDIDI